MTTVIPVERQGVVVGEQKHKECCVVGEGGRQERRGEIVDYQRVLDEKERSWTRMTCCDARKAARKHKGLHHAFLEGGGKRRLENTKVRTMQPSPFLEVSPLFVLLKYSLGVL